MLGFGKNGDAQVYLVDFGLASHFTTKDFKPDPKKMHNGTIEYTSRDAHNGVPTMRGDFEILGYNLIHWLGSSLPWENVLEKPPKVQESKENFIEQIESSLKKCFADGVPDPISQFMKYVKSLTYKQQPDYSKCRKFFEAGLKALGKKNSGVFEFSTTKSKVSPVKRSSIKESPVKRIPIKVSKKIIEVDDETEEDEEEGESENVSPKVVVKKTKEKVAAVKVSPKKAAPTITVEKSGLIINNNIGKSSASKGVKKTYNVNLHLDLSMDADVIVNVSRKRKSEHKALTQDDNAVDDADDDEVVASSETDSPGNKIPKKKTTERSNARTSPKTPNANVTVRKTSSRAKKVK